MKKIPIVLLFFMSGALCGMDDATKQFYENVFLKRLFAIMHELQCGPESMPKLHRVIQTPILDFKNEPHTQWRFIALFREQFDNLVASLAEYPRVQAMLHCECASIMKWAWENVLIIQSDDPSGVVLDLSSATKPVEFRLTKKHESKIVRGNCAALAYFYAYQALKSKKLNCGETVLAKQKQDDAELEMQRVGHRMRCAKATQLALENRRLQTRSIQKN